MNQLTRDDMEFDMRRRVEDAALVEGVRGMSAIELLEEECGLDWDAVPDYAYDPNENVYGTPDEVNRDRGGDCPF